MEVKTKNKIRALGKVLFVLYILFIFYFLLLSDWYGRSGGMQEYHCNLVLLKEIKRFWIYREQLGMRAVLQNLVGNVLVFVPFGFFSPMASKNSDFLKTAFCSFGISLCVEIFQLITKVGSFDVDDLLLNTIGGVLGYLLFGICNAVRRRHAKRKG